MLILKDYNDLCEEVILLKDFSPLKVMLHTTVVRTSWNVKKQETIRFEYCTLHNVIGKTLFDEYLL